MSLPPIHIKKFTFSMFTYLSMYIQNMLTTSTKSYLFSRNHVFSKILRVIEEVAALSRQFPKILNLIR